MTEQQINNLKKILSSNNDGAESINELDVKILTAAKAKISENNNVMKKSSESWLLKLFDLRKINFISLNYIGPVTASLLLTFGLFLGMSYMVSVENDNELLSYNTIEKSELIMNSEAVVVIEQEKIINGSRFTLTEPPTSTQTRDQILAGMDFPDIAVLLNTMKFTYQEDRILAEITIVAAMDDIRFMIMDGELNNARQRYERLRRSCDVCTLPETLEALVLNDRKLPARS